MRGYLAKFQKMPPPAQVLVENPPVEEPSKPSKPGFAGFDGSPEPCLPKTQSQFQMSELPPEFFEIVPDGEPSKPSKPSFDGFDGSRGRDVPAENEMPDVLLPGTCPYCRAVANLQDRARDTWWCSGCRRFFDSVGAPLPPAEIRRPLISEDVEPAKLAVDLLAAGCSFQDDEGGFRIFLPTSISATLLARWEAVDSAKLRLAAARLAPLSSSEEHGPGA